MRKLVSSLSQMVSLSAKASSSQPERAMVLFVAVQCFCCKQLQVCQRRRHSRFVCKLCNASQSVRKVFARSTRAAELRPFVQSLNLERGLAAERYDDEHRTPVSDSDCERDNHNDELDCQNGQVTPTPCAPLRSRWRHGAEALNGIAVATDSSLRQTESSDEDDQIVTALPDEIRCVPRARKRAFHRTESRNSQQTPCYDRRATRRRRITPSLPRAPDHAPMPTSLELSEQCTVLAGDEQFHEEMWD